MRFLLILLMSSALSIAQSDADRLLPPEHFESGWRYDFAPETFTPETLHEYINGEAELYRQFGVREMVTASYIQDKKNWRVTVDVYDMGSALNAFGVYCHSRRPDLTFADIGEQAIVSDYQIRFYKSRFYVQLNAASADSGMQQVMRSVATSMAVNIESVPKSLLLNLLPDSLSIANSARLYPSRFADLVFGVPVLSQSYDTDSGKFNAVAARYPTASEAKTALASIQSSSAYNDAQMKFWQQQNFLVGLRGNFNDAHIEQLMRSVNRATARR